MSEASGPWTGALIALLSIVVGAAITQLRDWWRARKTKARVAATLASEIVLQAEQVANCGSLANFVEQDVTLRHKVTPMRLGGLLPAESSAYSALIAHLPLLSPEAIARVMDYHASLDLAKRASEQYAEEGAFPRHHFVMLGYAWRNAAAAAIEALRSIQGYIVPTPRRKVGHVQRLIDELVEVVKKRYPRIQLNSETGEMRFGRGATLKPEDGWTRPTPPSESSPTRPQVIVAPGVS
jgi:hypothetical protein